MIARQLLNETRKGLGPSNIANTLRRSSRFFQCLEMKPTMQSRCLSMYRPAEDNAKMTRVDNKFHLSITLRSSSTSATPNNSSKILYRIKPWKIHMIESNGDYRNEAFLETDDEIGGPLYRNQASLPRLPVPELRDTVERFLPTALPLAKSKGEVDALKKACDTFPTEAKKLQERLINRSQGEMKDSSWLQLYWNQLGYLQVRDSVVVNVSYFFQFQNDPTVAVKDGKANIQRAATLLFATAEFRKGICSGAMEPEVTGKAQTPLDATAYKYMFHACRIPRKFQDTYRIYDPSRYSHAIVARKGIFFAIDILDKETGDPLPLMIIEDQLQQCIDMADEYSSMRPKLGILTSTNRDRWADARESLLALGEKTVEKALEVLESGVVLVSLDDTDFTDSVECSEMFLTGRKESGDNRWFDKSIQLIVDETGQAGTLSEHSMMDGMPAVKYADYITSATYDDVKERSSDASHEQIYRPEDVFAKALENIDVTVLNELEDKARAEFLQNIGKQSASVVSFDGYGSSFIKNSGNPPDAFVQLALQLATYRLFGEQVGTYEATQVRRFLHGRTEVTRAVTIESSEFVKRMGMTACNDVDAETAKEKFEFLQKATSAHASYSQQAAQAMGVDRHFFGLSMLRDEGEAPPALFADPVFNRSKYWRLSTSNLSHPRIVNWGFGQVVPDGLGVAYSVHPNSLQFHISALAETGWTPKFASKLTESLQEMAEVACVATGETPRSKL